MYAYILAIDADTYTGDRMQKGGKHTIVDAKEVELSCSGQELRIKTVTRETVKSGTRDGQPKVVIHDSLFKLSAEELRQVFELAIHCGLISLPGLADIREAHKLLDVGLAQLSVKSHLG
jgi:hypothetical protein